MLLHTSWVTGCFKRCFLQHFSLCAAGFWDLELEAEALHPGFWNSNIHQHPSTSINIPIQKRKIHQHIGWIWTVNIRVPTRLTIAPYYRTLLTIVTKLCLQKQKKWWFWASWIFTGPPFPCEAEENGPKTTWLGVPRLPHLQQLSTHHLRLGLSENVGLIFPMK